jgi:hypothetical protein
MVRAQSAITVLDTQLQHAELAANGRCKVAIQTAQAGLLGFKATVDGIKQAIDAYDVAGIQSAGQGLAGTSKTFNDQLDSIAGACGAAAAPNA